MLVSNRISFSLSPNPRKKRRGRREKKVRIGTREAAYIQTNTPDSPNLLPSQRGKYPSNNSRLTRGRTRFQHGIAAEQIHNDVFPFAHRGADVDGLIGWLTEEDLLFSILGDEADETWI